MAHIQHGTIVGMEREGIANAEGAVLPRAVSTLAVDLGVQGPAILTGIEGRINKSDDTVEIVVLQSIDDALQTAAMLIDAAVRTGMSMTDALAHVAIHFNLE